MTPRPRRLARRRAPPAAPRLSAEAVPFQDPLEALIAEPPPRILRGLHWLVAALFIGLVGLSVRRR